MDSIWNCHYYIVYGTCICICICIQYSQYGTCRLILSSQRRGFRSDNGCVAQPVFRRQSYPQVQLRFCWGITSSLHLPITWKIHTHIWINLDNTSVNIELITESAAEKKFAQNFKQNNIRKTVTIFQWWYKYLPHTPKHISLLQSH